MSAEPQMPYAADNWREQGYPSPEAEIDDMANVGRALMEVLPEGYYYNDCPSEIVCDLLNDIADLRAALEAALPRLAHPHKCWQVRPSAEWAEHGSASFENCSCEIKQVRAALASAQGIVAATAGETEGLDERSEQSPVGEADAPKTQSEGSNNAPE